MVIGCRQKEEDIAEKRESLLELMAQVTLLTLILSLESGNCQADGQESALKGEAQGRECRENTHPYTHRPVK
jgi:hypothetical protein